MRRALTVNLILAALALAGCDPSYVVHYYVKVVADEKPALGAWVLGLNECREKKSVRTGTDGKAQLDAGGFLCNPVGSPVVVYRPGERLRVAVPTKDFKTHGHGVCFVTEWDAELELALSPLPKEPGLTAKCEARRCELVTDADSKDACVGYLAEFGPSHATLLPVADRTKTEPAGQGALRLIFEIPEQGPEKSERFYIGLCYPPEGASIPRVIVSDALP